MGCGASVEEEPAPPPLPADPLEALLVQIEAERKKLKGKVGEHIEKETEARYWQTAVKKCDEITNQMEDELDDAMEMYKSLVMHIANQDALDLKEASEGFGTDEVKMAKVIVGRLPETIALTDQIYRRNYGRSLEDQIRGENHSLVGMLTGSMTNFGKFLCYRAMPTEKRDSLLVHKCMSGFGCSDFILMELLSTRTNQQLKDAAAAYAEDQDGKDMVERIKEETGGFGKKWYGLWCDELVNFDRVEEPGVHGDPAEMAQALYDAGEGKWVGCDEQPFIDHLCKANDETVKAIVDAYEALDDSKKTLFKAVEDKMGGDLEFAVLARLRPRPEFFAYRIFKACKGWGTDEECIGRVISCMTKKECQAFELFYNECYAEEDEPLNNLRDCLASELSGNFLDAIFMMMDTSSPKGHRVPEKTYDGTARQAADYFCNEVAEKHEDNSARTIGGSEMDGCFELCGFQDPNDLFTCRADENGNMGYGDVTLEPGRDKYQDPDKSALLDGTPGDLDAAQALLGQLQAANGKEDSEVNATGLETEAFKGLLPTKNNQFKWTDHILLQYRSANANMLEFCASRDADLVNEAVTGWGTDESKLIRVLCALPKKQLQRVNDIYIERFGKSLREVTDDELGGFFEGNFKYFMKCALTKDTELDAELLVESMKGWGTDDTMLCELICTRSNKELKEAKAIFLEQEGKALEQWVDGDTSGGYQDFLMACLAANRDESLVVNSAQAKNQAANIKNCLDGGADYAEVKFLARASVKQVEEIKNQYQAANGSDMMEDIKEKAPSEWAKILTARCYDKPSYYANTMQGAMKGWGTDENALSRVVGRSSKGDLKRAEARFLVMFGKSLTATIESEVGGNFKKALLTYLSTEAPGAPEAGGETAAPTYEVLMGWPNDVGLMSEETTPCDVNAFMASLQPGMGYYSDPGVEGGFCRSISVENVATVRQAKADGEWTEHETGSVSLPQ